jgi:peptidyl-dipeptidase Dcp
MSAIDLASHPLTEWNGPLGLPAFDQVRVDDFGPVIEAALAAHAAEIDAIANDEAPATIDNTLKRLELSGRPLARANALFWMLAGADTSPEIQALERDLAPKLARHFAAIQMNPKLFARIDALYADRKGLDAETARALEKTWKRFVRSGAKLDDAGKARLAAIGERLASLGAGFGQNVLADEQDWALLLDDKDVAGLPPFLVSAMAAAAAARGASGRYAITLSRSIMEPFLAFSPRRDLREKAFAAFIGRGANDGEHDNRPIVAETLALRAEKARLLGYATYADYKLEDQMAKNPDAVMGLLTPVWEAARTKAAEREAELAALAAREGVNDPIRPWDWRYFSEKLKTARFAFDDAELKPYLPLKAVTAAAFDVASRLFGLAFVERPDIAAWRPEVRVFEVRGTNGGLKAVFLSDPFARASKRSGAWMSALKSQHGLDGGETPIIYNVMNFAAPPAGEPALLSLDEAKTLFHEFGHALHGMLSRATWPSLSGTAVARDFVELPSQLYEHWLTTREVLAAHARHVETGEAMPAALIDKLKAARNFDAGFATIEFTASALVDMAFHREASPPADVAAFERATLESLAMPSSIAMRHATPHFAHAFSGEGYSAGYYSYMWSEVLDADAFAAFEEAGDPFDEATARKLGENIYAAGDTAAPEALYEAFRGRMPSPQAMMAKRGLA